MGVQWKHKTPWFVVLKSFRLPYRYSEFAGSALCLRSKPPPHVTIFSMLFFLRPDDQIDHQRRIILPSGLAIPPPMYLYVMEFTESRSKLCYENAKHFELFLFPLLFFSSQTTIDAGPVSSMHTPCRRRPYPCIIS